MWCSYIIDPFFVHGKANPKNCCSIQGSILPNFVR